MPSLLFADASTSVSLPQDNSVADGAWHYLTFWWDETAGDLFFKTSADGETSSLATGISDPDCTLNLCCNASWSAHTSSGAQQQVAYLGFCEGANAQNMYDEDFWQHAEDPSGFVTLQKRTSLIGAPVGAGYVSQFAQHATAAQLPIAFSPLLVAGVGGYGLLTNSSITNLIASSEELGGADWNPSNMTLTDNFGDSPAGFRNATKLAATAANGYVASDPFTVSSNTIYTVSAYVKEITAGCVGRLILWDATAGAELAGVAFTCDSTWDNFVSLTATTGGSMVSAELRVRIDANTEECYAWGAMATLYERTEGSYVKTTGASASLVFCDYECLGTTGQFIDASSQNEAEVVWVGTHPSKVGRNSEYLGAFWGVSVGSTWIMTLGTSNTTPSLQLYNSSSGLESNVNTAVIDPAAQENTQIMQGDPDGGLTEGPSGEGAINVNGGAFDSTVGTFTATDSLTKLQLGNAGHSTTNTTACDIIISRIRTWDGER